MAEIDRERLLKSLAAQRKDMSRSIVLTPTDSLPFSLADRSQTAFLHGLYLTDKVRSEADKAAALVQFAGRDLAAKDIREIYRFVASSFGAAEGSLRLLSGLHAQTATLMSVTRIGQKIALLSEEGGGHYSTHGIAERLGLRCVDLPVDHVHLRIDREGALRLIRDEKPDVVFIDRSEGLTYEDFKFVGQLEQPITIFDASQYVVPTMSGRYENPLTWGFDLMMFSTHKSFPGPQKAAIVGRESGEIWHQLNAGLSMLVSSSHAEDAYLTALAMLRSNWMRTYEHRLFTTAEALDRELAELGISRVDRRLSEAESPATHHIWIKCITTAEAFARYQSLAAVGIQTNYRKLPYSLGYGLRLGTTHAVVAGIAEAHVPELVSIMKAAMTSGPTSELRDRTATLAKQASRSAILPTDYWHEE